MMDDRFSSVLYWVIWWLALFELNAAHFTTFEKLNDNLILCIFDWHKISKYVNSNA